MERFLAQLCGTSAARPLPLWEGNTTGHCFTQLVLSALPHALLAVLSACHLGTPRTPDYNPPCSPGWSLRLIASCLLSIFPLLDLLPVALPPGADPGPIWLEVLAGCVTAVAWITHSLALWVLAHSPHSRSRGPLALALSALLPTPSLVLTLLWHCQQDMFLSPLLPGPVARLCLLILQLAAVFAYGLGWAVPGGPGEPWTWTQELFLSSEVQESEVAEDGESWLSRFSYAWLTPLLTRGVHGELRQPHDICRLPHRLHPAYLARFFQAHWQEGAQLWRALYGAFGWWYLALGLLKLVGTMLAFSGPLLLSLLVGFLEEGHEPLSHGLLYALGLASGAVLSAVLQNQYGYEVRKVTLQARGAVLNTMYRKVLQLGPSRPPTGEVLNLLGTDSERLLNFASSFHEAWGLPLQLAITLYLLYQQVGLAFVAGLVLAPLLVPVNKVIATRIMASNQEMLQYKDARVKVRGGWGPTPTSRRRRRHVSSVFTLLSHPLSLAHDRAAEWHPSHQVLRVGAGAWDSSRSLPGSRVGATSGHQILGCSLCIPMGCPASHHLHSHLYHLCPPGAPAHCYQGVHGTGIGAHAYSSPQQLPLGDQ
uniref:ABC-type xenobiotic transporter n=1 Tax=Castor canadensis TaxID=51338 RepID=A0A8C0WSF0_CASCN